MKMHPKPTKRHARYVETFEFAPKYDEHCGEPFQLRFKRVSDGATQIAFFNEEEAKELLENLATVVHYRDLPASEINSEEWADFHRLLKKICEPPECNHDWEDGFSMNGPTKTCRKCGMFMRD